MTYPTRAEVEAARDWLRRKADADADNSVFGYSAVAWAVLDWALAHRPATSGTSCFDAAQRAEPRLQPFRDEGEGGGDER